MFKGFKESSIGNDDPGIRSFPHPNPFSLVLCAHVHVAAFSDYNIQDVVVTLKAEILLRHASLTLFYLIKVS